MSKRKSSKSCLHCGTNFIGYARSLFCCDVCRRLYHREARAEKKRLWKMQKARQEERQNGKVSDVEEANKIIRWIERHYKETGVLLSYGKAVAFMERECKA